MPIGTLFVVATPIGNLEDITLRALRVLREVDIIAAEDTRHTARLLARHGIATPTISFHAHNTRARVPELMRRLAEGARVAVVSDAGTPGISDPGLELVQACVEQGVPVDPIPGPSAPLAAVVASGFPMTPLTILGFVPSRSKDRSGWFTVASRFTHTWVFFDSPLRISASLSAAAQFLGDRPIVVARELTKVHQQFIRGSAASLAGRFTAAKGEFTIVVGPARPSESRHAPVSDTDIAHVFGEMTEHSTGSRRSQIAEVARRVGRSPREVYAAIERVKKSGD